VCAVARAASILYGSKDFLIPILIAGSRYLITGLVLVLPDKKAQVLLVFSMLLWVFLGYVRKMFGKMYERL
jgi:hypothetical protein